MQLLQLTDPHLFTDPTDRLRGVPTAETFKAVLEAALESCPLASRVVVSGDVAQDEARATYVGLRDQLDGLYDRVRVIPGNHDTPADLRDVFRLGLGVDAGPKTSFAETVEGWRIVGLDSNIGGAADGEIGGEQRSWLAEQLADGAPAVVFVHHPPTAIGTPWLDGIGLRDGADLVDLLAGAGNVRALFHGHTHQESHVRPRELDVYGTPSTAFQFAGGGDDLRIDRKPPGFRRIALLDGAVKTDVHRLSSLTHAAVE